jgi:cation transport ATPase
MPRSSSSLVLGFLSNRYRKRAAIWYFVPAERRTPNPEPMTKQQQNLGAPKQPPETPLGRVWSSPSALWRRKSTVIAGLSLVAIILHLGLRFGFHTAPGTLGLPLLVALILGGLPMLYDLLRKLLKREFGSDLLGGISIITSVLLGEYLAGTIIHRADADGRGSAGELRIT